MQYISVLQISAIYCQHRDISRCSNLGDIIVKNRSIYSSDFLHKKIASRWGETSSVRRDDFYVPVFGIFHLFVAGIFSAVDWFGGELG